MAWRYLPHQLNNRKFSKAVVFVHGSTGSVNTWMGAPNRFVDRLSHVPAVYNQIGLYVFGYDPTIFTVGGVGRLLARIPDFYRIVTASFKVEERVTNTSVHKQLLM